VEQKELYEIPDQDYPLLLTTGRSLFHFHTGTMTRRTSLLDREVQGPVLDIHPKDAERLGIRGGQTVIVESRRGRLELLASIDPGVGEGMVFVPFHFQEAPANVLTSWALDPASKIPAFKVSAVRIRRADQ
jgi:anaerobic selenocysteine-containing dehydrogenase